MTQTPVSVGSVTLRPGNMSIHDFIIYNPPHALSDIALSIDHTAVDLSLDEYMQTDSVIESVELENIYINIELYDKKRTMGNWQTIMDNINRSQPQSQPTVTDASSSDTVIRRLILRHINIDLMLFKSPIKTYHIPQLVFHDLSTGNGLPAKKIVSAIVKKIIPSIFLETGINFVLKSPGKIIKDTFSPLIAPFTKKSNKQKKEQSKTPSNN